MSTADELQKLKNLLDNGVLTKEEFDTEKKKVLGTQDNTQKLESSPQQNFLNNNENIGKEEQVVKKEKIITTIEPSKKIYYYLLILLPFIFIDFVIWFWINIILALIYTIMISSTYYEITNLNIIKYFKFISKSKVELDRDAIETVSLNQGFIQRLLQTGTIRVTGRGISEFLIRDIDEPEYIQQLLDK